MFDFECVHICILFYLQEASHALGIVGVLALAALLAEAAGGHFMVIEQGIHLKECIFEYIHYLQAQEVNSTFLKWNYTFISVHALI